MKKVDRVDRDLPVDVRNSLWVARHYKQIFIASVSIALLALIFTFIMVNRQAGVIVEQSRVIQNMANKVVFVRADGKVAILEKEELSQSMLQLALRDLVINYVILSGFDLGDVREMKEAEKLRKVQKVLAYLENTRGYAAYVERILASYKNNNLPELIWVGDLTELREDMRYQDGGFSYIISLPVNVLYVLNERWNRGRGQIQIRLSGTVNAAKGSPENPLGIYIKDFEVVQYVSKSGY